MVISSPGRAVDQIRTGAFETGPAAFADQIEIELDATNARHVIGVCRKCR